MSEKFSLDSECPNKDCNKPCDKIYTPYAEMIYDPTAQGDYWNIHYLDPTDGKLHIGFGSYKRENVERWLKEEFVVYDTNTTSIDAALQAALRELGEVIMAKYPDAIHVTITLEGGNAKLDIRQNTSTRFVDRKRVQVKG